MPPGHHSNARQITKQGNLLLESALVLEALCNLGMFAMLSDLSRQIFEEVNKALSHQPGAQAGKQFHAALQAALSKLNLVSRDEFDAQSAVLLRTREKLEALEQQVEELERQLKP